MNNLLKIAGSMIMLCIASILFAQPVTEDKKDGAYEKDLDMQKETLTHDHIRQADVFWEKRVWRVIDFREKMNLPFVWPGNPFMQNIYNLLMNGEITAYSPLYDDFKGEHAFTKEEVGLKLNRMDTLIIYDEETNTEIKKPLPVTFNYQDVKKMKIKEDWIFDAETSQMVVRIIGIAPVKQRIDPETGEPIGEEDMFWLYYPDLRQYLVKHTVFNTENSARSLTFEDIFENRFFSSYIIKEDNVYDRYINSYATGIDQVLESGRIKYDIFQFEHTLWEF